MTASAKPKDYLRGGSTLHSNLIVKPKKLGKKPKKRIEPKGSARKTKKTGEKNKKNKKNKTERLSEGGVDFT